MSRAWFIGSILILSFLSRLPAEVVEIQVAPAIGPRPVAPPGGKETKKPVKEEEIVEPNRKTSAPLDPEFLRLHMQDGALLTGKVSVKEIEVTTSFGKLTVPIAKIVSFTPGLDSNPQILADLEKTITSLGSDDYKTREQAHKDLAKMGPRIRAELERFSGSDNAEIKRHIGEILKEFDEEAENADDELAVAPKALLRLDTVVTTDFTVIGRVAPAEFKLNSRYGELNVKLADVRIADRPQDTKETLQRSLVVSGQNIAQRNFKSSGIRVAAGDRIVVKADGSMTMTPWGSNAMSTPEGAANYGWYVPNEIAGGALVARIGDKGPVFKIGKQHTFTAKSSGVLMFAVGVQAEYAGEGYQFPGEYKLKVRVDPK